MSIATLTTLNDHWLSRTVVSVVICGVSDTYPPPLVVTLPLDSLATQLLSLPLPPTFILFSLRHHNLAYSNDHPFNSIHPIDISDLVHLEMYLLTHADSMFLLLTFETSKLP